MNVDKLDFTSKSAVADFVNGCEERYLADVKKACDVALGGGKIITLCGPTCSGKTTTALILDDEFKACGKELHTISIDDFYFDKEYLISRSLEKGIPLDYDSPYTIDVELFASSLEQICSLDKVRLPKFDFKTGSRSGFEEISLTDGDIFLFEGIQAVYPNITKHLAGHNYTSIFISVADDVCIDGALFTAREIRFMRRLVRDARARGATAEFTFSLWESVVKNEIENIYPNLSGVDFSINSAMGYEPCVIKPYVLPLLYEIKAESAFYARARALIEKLENIPQIDSEFISDDSVFREFIGKKA